MAEASVVDQLKVRFGQEYRVKLGKSFTFPKENAFHSLKYDFKPLSIDSSRPGRLKVAEDEVNVSLPVGQGELAEDFAQFRGGKKPCTKECVLIIDTNTGEAILERISNTVNLKAIRDGRKSVLARDRSISPLPPHVSQQKPQTTKSQSQLVTSSTVASAANNNTATPPTTSTAGKTATKTKGSKRHAKKMPKMPKNASASSLSTKQDGATTKTGSVATTVTNSSSKQKKGVPKIKTEPQNVTFSSTSSSASNLLSLPTTSMSTITHAPSMPNFGTDTTIAAAAHEISPLYSANPTPEPRPLAPPPNKKLKAESSSSSSSSSSSDSSDDEGAGLVMKAPPTHVLQQHTTTQSHHHQPQSQMQQPSHLHNMSHMPQLPHHQASVTQYQSHVTQSVPLIGQQPVRQQQPNQLSVESSSSSDSDSGSSSGSSSSDSSSDSSDQENDREVASYNSRPPVRQMSMSQLRTDLQLSDSGSDSD